MSNTYYSLSHHLINTSLPNVSIIFLNSEKSTSPLPLVSTSFTSLSNEFISLLFFTPP